MNEHDEMHFDPAHYDRWTSLVLSFFYPAMLAWRSNQFLYVVFVIIFSVNILVESMLEVQAGVVFYAFFNAFLFTAIPARIKVAKS